LSVIDSAMISNFAIANDAENRVEIIIICLCAKILLLV